MPEGVAMHERPENHVILGKLIQAFIRAGWNPPTPSTRITRRILDDIAQGRDGNAMRNATLDLAPQQRAALTLTAIGLSGPEAATAMGISHETIRSHLKKARERLGASNTAHAVAIAVRHELIELPDDATSSTLAA
jgi:DNA-binding CsgD family transcriptional regulator